VRWDDLFADLEGQLEQELGAEDLDVAAEEERLRLGRLSLRDRIAALAAQTGALELTEGARVELRVETVGRDWVSGSAMGSRSASCLVPLDAIAGMSVEPDRVASSLATSFEHPDALSRRLGLSFVLRDLCRRRCPIDVTTSARALHGTIDRVGRDHLDLALHDPGEPRRPNAVRELRIVPFRELLLVRIRT